MLLSHVHGIDSLMAAAQAGQEVPIGFLRNLSMALKQQQAQVHAAMRGNALRKGSVGTVQQGTAYASASGSELAPLVPQSIDNVLDVAEFEERNTLCLWNDIFKNDVTSPLHENTVITDYGSPFTPFFFPEGGAPPNDESTFARQVCTVKFMARRIEVSDVGMMTNMVGIQGVEKGALNIRTMAGTRSLLAQLEHWLFHGDIDLNALGFSGLFKQVLSYSGVKQAIANTDYYRNVNGKLTPEILAEELNNTGAPDRWANPNVVYVGHDVWQVLANEALVYGRSQIAQVAASKAEGTVYAAEPGSITPQHIALGLGALSIITRFGPVPVKAAPLIDYIDTPISTAVGDYPPAALNGANFAYLVGADASSAFTATDAGDYIFKIVAHGDRGATAALTLNGGAAFTVAAGQSVRIEHDDSAFATSGNTSTRYYSLYRSDKNGAASTCKFVHMFPRNTSGALGGTQLYDENFYKPGHSPAICGQIDKGTARYNQLLPLFRRPLAQVDTRVPLLLMLFGVLHVPIPARMTVLGNCQRSVA